MQNNSQNIEEEEFARDPETLTAAITEAEDLLADLAIEMRMQAKGTRPRAKQISEGAGKQQL
jgi:hypothetical protein